VESVKDAVGELIAAIVLVALLLFSALGSSGCRVPDPAEPIPADVVEPGPGLTVDEQAAAAVEVLACNRLGSGVIVGEHRIITAQHVIGDCAEVQITTAAGRRLLAVRVAMWPDDVALLAVAETLTERSPRIFGIRSGDRGCLVAAAPVRVRECGTVVVALQRYGGIMHTAKTVRGNSGSGFYDARGHLVGIVVEYIRVGGGTATPVGSRLAP
jgi:hypothetical protein